ncbi:MAG: hypothetical protein ACRYFV_13600 [Janthinobacterium lividum]
MAVKKADEYQHNNPDRAFVDSAFVRGGRRVVADRAALYALANKADQLLEQVTLVRVLSDDTLSPVGPSEQRLVNAAQISSPTGWLAIVGDGGTGGQPFDNSVNEQRLGTTTAADPALPTSALATLDQSKPFGAYRNNGAGFRGYDTLSAATIAGSTVVLAAKIASFAATDVAAMPPLFLGNGHTLQIPDGQNLSVSYRAVIRDTTFAKPAGSANTGFLAIVNDGTVATAYTANQFEDCDIRQEIRFFPASGNNPNPGIALVNSHATAVTNNNPSRPCMVFLLGSSSIDTVGDGVNVVTVGGGGTPGATVTENTASFYHPSVQAQAVLGGAGPFSLKGGLDSIASYAAGATSGVRPGEFPISAYGAVNGQDVSAAIKAAIAACAAAGGGTVLFDTTRESFIDCPFTQASNGEWYQIHVPLVMKNNQFSIRFRGVYPPTHASEAILLLTRTTNGTIFTSRGTLAGGWVFGCPTVNQGVYGERNFLSVICEDFEVRTQYGVSGFDGGGLITWQMRGSFKVSIAEPLYTSQAPSNTVGLLMPTVNNKAQHETYGSLFVEGFRRGLIPGEHALIQHYISLGNVYGLVTRWNSYRVDLTKYTCESSNWSILQEYASTELSIGSYDTEHFYAGDGGTPAFWFNFQGDILRANDGGGGLIAIQNTRVGRSYVGPVNEFITAGNPDYRIYNGPGQNYPSTNTGTGGGGGTSVGYTLSGPATANAGDNVTLTITSAGSQACHHIDLYDTNQLINSYPVSSFPATITYAGIPAGTRAIGAAIYVTSNSALVATNSIQIVVGAPATPADNTPVPQGNAAVTVTVDDHFADSLLPGFAQGFYGAASYAPVVSNGQLQLSPLAGGGNNGGITTTGGYDARNGFIQTKMVQALANAVSCDQGLFFGSAIDHAAFLQVEGRQLYGIVRAPSLAQQVIAVSVPYNPAAHAFMRLRAQNNKWYFDVSPDGATYSCLGYVAAPYDMDGSNGKAALLAGTNGSNAAPGTAVFESLKLGTYTG